jgi:hypothetical protein
MSTQLLLTKSRNDTNYSNNAASTLKTDNNTQRTELRWTAELMKIHEKAETVPEEFCRTDAEQ